MMTGLLTHRVLDALRGEKDPPVALNHPWSEPTTEQSVTPEERAALHALLIENSALAHLPD